VVVESASVAGQSFFRVLVGPEQNKVQADRLVSQLKSESYIAGNPFIRKVK
jgi:cell division septation protein DedD